MPLRDDCKGVVPPSYLPFVPKRFDVIGDIAVLKLPDELLPWAGSIAQAVTSRRRNIRSVARKVTKVAGNTRVATYELIAGTGTETVHREHGFSYRLDIAGTFFAPRLATERKRVTGMVKPGERVLVPFAGVGPFAIPAAVRGGGVVAIELNPAAFRYLAMNAAGNGVRGMMTLIAGDAFDTSLLPEGRFDRAIIPAPYGQDQILPVIAPFMKEGAILHFYTFRKKAEIPSLVRQYGNSGLSVLGTRRCGNVAPGVNRWAFTLVKTR